MWGGTGMMPVVDLLPTFGPISTYYVSWTKGSGQMYKATCSYKEAWYDFLRSNELILNFKIWMYFFGIQELINTCTGFEQVLS